MQDALKRMRKNRGLTQADLAEKCGVSRALIAMIEAGHIRPYPRIRREIAEALGVPEDVLFPPGGDACLKSPALPKRPYPFCCEHERECRKQLVELTRSRDAWMEDARWYSENADFWRGKYESLREAVEAREADTAYSSGELDEWGRRR